MNDHPSLTRAMHEKAERLSALVPTLSRWREPQTGVRGVIFPSSDDPEHTGHRANALWCSCPGFSKRNICTHQAAVARAEHRAQSERIAEAQRRGRPCKVNGCEERATTLVGRCSPCFDRMIEQLGV